MSSKRTGLYEPLDGFKAQIRLVKLISKSPDDVLQFTLQTFNFEDAPLYKALSYEWGPPATKEIRINDYVVSIRRNLWDFFTRRSIEEDSAWAWLWVDQLCIKQEDAMERSSQVAMMGSIYAKSQDTFAWLGSASDLDKIGIQAIKKALSERREIKSSSLANQRWQA